MRRMMHRVQAVPLNYPSQPGIGAETQATARSCVQVIHLANDSRSTQHIPVTGAEWGESGPRAMPGDRLFYVQLGGSDAVSAVELSIDNRKGRNAHP